MISLIFLKPNLSIEHLGINTVAMCAGQCSHTDTDFRLYILIKQDNDQDSTLHWIQDGEMNFPLVVQKAKSQVQFSEMKTKDPPLQWMHWENAE